MIFDEMNKFLNKRNEDIDYRYNWHFLMMHYGYFSKEIFLKMDADDIDYLLNECSKLHNVKENKKGANIKSIIRNGK